MTRCKERAYVDRHFEGTISPIDEHAMREHLPRCSECNAYYGRWLVLSRLDPAALSSEKRIAQGLGFAAKSRPRAVIPIGAVSLLAAAAALLLWVRVKPETSGFTARGILHSGADAKVFVYDVRPGEPAGLATASIARGDELAFAYENASARNRLMILGVDEHQHVYWFYPAWTSEGENPIAIPVATDGRRHELPEAVRHEFDGTQLNVRAIFVDSPISVRSVEALLREHPVGPLPLPGAIETSTAFTLAP